MTSQTLGRKQILSCHRRENGTFCQDGVRLHDVSCSAEKPTVCEAARFQETLPKATSIQKDPLEATEVAKTRPDPTLSPEPTRFSSSSSRDPSLSTSRSPKSLPASNFSQKTMFPPSFSSRPVVSSDFLFQPSTSSRPVKPLISAQPHFKEQGGPFSPTLAGPSPATTPNITDTTQEVRNIGVGVESMFQIFHLSGDEEQFVLWRDCSIISPS